MAAPQHLSVQAELGPVLPPRTAVYAVAAEVHALARLALEFTTPGGTVDVARALRQLDRIRAVLGETVESGGRG